MNQQQPNQELRELASSIASEWKVPPEELALMLEALERGEDATEFFAQGPEGAGAFEAAAISLFNQHKFEQAQAIFRFLLLISGSKNPRALRGYAACRQALLDFPEASQAYLAAICFDSTDTVSMVGLAECCWSSGQEAAAHQALTLLFDHLPADQAELPHVKRAAAMRLQWSKSSQSPQSAGSATNPPKRASTAPPAEASPPSGDHPADSEDVIPAAKSADPEIRAFVDRPHVKEKLAQLSDMFERNVITLREIADFSQEQIDAGYAICCTLLEQRDYAKCLEVSGWMLHIDGHDARFFQLAGLSALGLELYCLAEYLFNMDTIWRTGGPDAATLLYKAEAHLRQEEVQEGLRVLEEGLKLAGNRLEYQPIVKRAKTMREVYGADRPA